MTISRNQYGASGWPLAPYCILPACSSRSGRHVVYWDHCNIDRRLRTSKHCHHPRRRFQRKLGIPTGRTNLGRHVPNHCHPFHRSGKGQRDQLLLTSGPARRADDAYCHRSPPTTAVPADASHIVLDRSEHFTRKNTGIVLSKTKSRTVAISSYAVIGSLCV